jgi:hypothetical protein
MIDKQTVTVWLTSPDCLPLLSNPEETIFYSIAAGGVDMTEYGWTKVQTTEVEITRPTIEACMAPALAAIKKAEDKLNADVQAKLNELQVLRSKLLSLGYSPTAATPPDAGVSDEVDSSTEDSWRNSCECIITGCGLVIDGSYYWGDLFRVRSTGDWVFNSTGANVRPFTDVTRSLIVDERSHATCSGKVFFINGDDAYLNQVAKDYLS